MKPSRFNIFLQHENGSTLAFNSTSAALAEIEAKNYPVIQRLLRDPSSASSDEERQFLEALVEGRYLVEDAIDELEVLKVRNRRQRFGSTTMMVTIAPTLACNFRCDYCFEAQSAGRMTQETEQALLQYVEPRLRRSEGLLITWFGGEPTLCLDTIERLQRGFQGVCARNGIEMQPSAIITNGYQLDGAMAARLKEAGVTDVQITLDGPARVHDTRRKLAGGGGTYARIIENLKESADILRISIRVNVDRDNYGSTTEILHDLKAQNLLSKVQIYFAQVMASTTVCADMRDRCYSTEEFSLGQVALYRRLIDEGFTQIEYPMLAPGGHCGADCDSALVVAPNGDLFKCWEELSADSTESVGSVHNSGLTPRQLKNQFKYLAWDPMEKSGCQACEILPMCMGGCPRHALQENSSTTGACCSWKYNLRDMLKLRYICDLRKEVKQ